jgi:hypothetical protein
VNNETDRRGTPPKFLALIRQEFERVEGPGSPGTEAHKRGGLRQGKVFVAAAVASLLVVGGAAAATGLIGDVVPAGEEDAHLAAPGGQRVVATGSSPVAGAWRLSALRHEAADGAPAGDCLKLELTAPPPGSPIAGTLLCQNVGEAQFKADSIPVVNQATGQAEALVFGASPKAATSVNARGTSSRAQLKEAAGSPVDAWLVPIPSGTSSAEVSWSRDGKIQDTLDASRYLEQVSIWERNILSKK